MTAIRVYIAEDEELIRKGLSIIINKEEDMEVVGSAENGLLALEEIKQYKPDLVLMDIQMPVMNGIECIRRIREWDSKIIIIILTAFHEEEKIIEGISSGANGYLIKAADFNSIIKVIREATKGNFLLPPEVVSKLVNYIYKNDFSKKEKKLPDYITQGDRYTRREQEILSLLIKRLTNKEISNLLYISEGTLKNYLTVIYEKLGVKNRLEAIQLLKK